MNKYFQALAIAFIIFCFSFANVYGQWSNDPTINTTVFQGGIHGPKIVSAENFYYISYYQVTPEGRIPYLQKINYDGYAEWPDDGLLINEYNQPSIFTQYDIKVDKENNAVLAFRNEELYQENYYISVYKISPEGEFLWGESGKRFDPPWIRKVAPQICINLDNSVTVISAVDNNENDPFGNYIKIGIKKYTSSGENAWEEEYSSIDSDVAAFIPIGILPGEKNSCYVVFYKQSDSDSEIFVRKIDTKGNKVWPADIQISQGDLGPGTTTTIKSGNDGELIVAWTNYGPAYGKEKINVSGINSDGSIIWDGYPIRMDGINSECQFAPNIGGQDSEDNFYVFWANCYSGFAKTELMGQKISKEGEILWESGGRKIIEGNSFGTLVKLIVNDTILLCYQDPIFSLDTYTTINLIAIDTNGDYCWEAPVILNSERTYKDPLTSTNIIDGQGVVCFGNHESWGRSYGQIKLQNFWLDGSMGSKSSFIYNNEISPSEVKIWYNYEYKIIEIENCLNLKSCSIFDLYGRLVKTVAISDTSRDHLTVSCTDFSSGLYYVKATTDFDVQTRGLFVN